MAPQAALPGLRMNLSKSGLSLSVGRKGAWYTSGRRGQRVTLGPREPACSGLRSSSRAARRRRALAAVNGSASLSPSPRSSAWSWPESDRGPPVAVNGKARAARHGGYRRQKEPQGALSIAFSTMTA